MNYGYSYPVYVSSCGGCNNNSNNNDGFGSGLWATIIVIFIIFFLFWGSNGYSNGPRGNYYNN